jgi:hypothetical protein
MYNLPRKFGVRQTYLRLWELSFPAIPAALELARESNAGWQYVAKVISEIHLHDEIFGPAEIRLGKNVQRGVGKHLTPKEEDMLLLSLRAEIPNAPPPPFGLLLRAPNLQWHCHLLIFRFRLFC